MIMDGESLYIISKSNLAFSFLNTKDILVYTFSNGSFGFFQAVTAMVQQAMQYIDETPDIETRIELIKTLNSVSAGKVSM